ncbi:unnamed protein product, partial [marine sediment metagenome]
MRATSPNTAYTAHFVNPNFSLAETSYILKPLYEIYIEIRRCNNKKRKKI